MTVKYTVLKRDSFDNYTPAPEWTNLSNHYSQQYPLTWGSHRNDLLVKYKAEMKLDSATYDFYLEFPSEHELLAFRLAWS